MVTPEQWWQWWQSTTIVGDPRGGTDMTQRKMTIHKDGTVTYWSVCRQVWQRSDVHGISDEDLAAMSADDRKRIMRAREQHPLGDIEEGR